MCCFSECLSGSPVYNDINVKDSLRAQRGIFFRLPPMSSSPCAIIKSSSSKEKQRRRFYR